MKEDGIKKGDGSLVHGITQKLHLKVFGFFFCDLFVTAKRNWNLNVNSMCLPY